MFKLLYDIFYQLNYYILATKTPLNEIDETSDILGISGVIIHDLKQNRMNNYVFHWNSILDVSYLNKLKLFNYSLIKNIF